MKTKNTQVSEGKKHKHDFQLLSYGYTSGYTSTLTDTVVLLVCRDCGKVFEEAVRKDKSND